MRKTQITLAIVAFFTVQSCFSDTEEMTSLFHNKPCASIAKACKKAGFSAGKNSDKRFWFDCMKPILLNKTVKGVTVDENTVKSCRAAKIEELKNEMDELQKSS